MEYSIDDLYSSFLKGRKNFVKREWLVLRSFFRRMFGSKKAFSELLSSEEKFIQGGIEWLESLEAQSYVNKDKASEIRSKLKSFKEELNSRNGFLIAFAVLIALSLAINTTFEQVWPTSGNYIYVLQLVTYAFALFVLLERINVLRHISYAAQLEILLERWDDES